MVARSLPSPSSFRRVCRLLAQVDRADGVLPGLPREEEAALEGEEQKALRCRHCGAALHTLLRSAAQRG